MALFSIPSGSYTTAAPSSTGLTWALRGGPIIYINKTLMLLVNFKISHFPLLSSTLNFGHISFTKQFESILKGFRGYDQESKHFSQSITYWSNDDWIRGIPDEGWDIQNSSAENGTALSGNWYGIVPLGAGYKPSKEVLLVSADQFPELDLRDRGLQGEGCCNLTKYWGETKW